MKKLILSLFILIGTVYYSHSQGLQIPSLTNTPGISYYKDGLGQWYYKVPLERAQVIDYWSRQGILARQKAEDRATYFEELMEQIRQAKLSSDSLSITLNGELLRTRNEVVNLSNENDRLQSQFIHCTDVANQYKIELQLEKDENKKLKRKLFWKNFTIVGTYVAAGVIGVVAITR